MSYILEALKKSEQERNPDKVPDLSTQHQGTVAQRSKRFPWAWVITVVILLNIIFWYLFLFEKPLDSSSQDEPLATTEEPVVKKDSQAQSTHRQESAKPETAVVTPQPEVVDTAPAKEETGLIGSKPVQEDTVIQTPEIKTEVIPTPRTSRTNLVSGFDDLPHVSELSLSLQQQIPDLSFTTHIYVRDGGSFVIINNKSLSDGMSLGSGLVLESIVKQGVILSYRNRRFTLRSMESWTTN
ncbi:MAG: GspB domain-containing protein [Enterobacterales bacterium]|nr:GspB domain-containing protein [Enterobacterales bacterium]